MTKGFDNDWVALGFDWGPDLQIYPEEIVAGWLQRVAIKRLETSPTGH